MVGSGRGILIFPGAGDLAVVFLHGIQGDQRETWTAKNGFCWPNKLNADLGCMVASIGYPAPVAGWADAMRISDRATNLLQEIAHEESLEGKQLILACHSYGGLVAKQMLRNSHERAPLGWFRRRLRGLAFLGTPHRGAALASLASCVGKIAGSTIIAEELESGSATVEDLHTWFLEHHSLELEAIHNLAERQDMSVARGLVKSRIVKPVEGEISLPGVVTIPLDCDHIELAKPEDETALQYKVLRKLVVRLMNLASNSESPRSNLRSSSATISAPRPTVVFADLLVPFPRLIAVLSQRLVPSSKEGPAMGAAQLAAKLGDLHGVDKALRDLVAKPPRDPAVWSEAEEFAARVAALVLRSSESVTEVRPSEAERPATSEAEAELIASIRQGRAPAFKTDKGVLYSISGRDALPLSKLRSAHPDQLEADICEHLRQALGLREGSSLRVLADELALRAGNPDQSERRQWYLVARSQGIEVRGVQQVLNADQDIQSQLLLIVVDDSKPTANPVRDALNTLSFVVSAARRATHG